jgi:hypothetical protein
MTKPPPLPASPTPQPDEAESVTIGSAHMLPDRTVHLRLSAVTPGIASGEALLIFKPDHPRHADIIRHLGGIEPDAYKPVPAFPPGLP